MTTGPAEAATVTPKSSSIIAKKASTLLSDAEKEWVRLGRLLTTERPMGIDSTNTMYDELMGKEDRVLSTIDRYIEDKKEAQLRETRFMYTPVGRLPTMFFRTMNDMLDEAMKARTGRDVRVLFIKDARPIYVGILLIIIALFILFV